MLDHNNQIYEKAHLSIEVIRRLEWYRGCLRDKSIFWRACWLVIGFDFIDIVHMAACGILTGIFWLTISS